MVRNVYEAAGDLKNTAVLMTHRMETTEVHADAVEAAASLAVANVANVAAATEQLSASAGKSPGWCTAQSIWWRRPKRRPNSATP